MPIKIKIKRYQNSKIPLPNRKRVSTSIEKCYAILLYHLKKPLYYLYHSILQYLPHPKTLFLLKYYSLIFFYYFFLTNVFFQFHFPRLSNRFFFFFLSLPQPLASVHLTEPHTHRPINRATHSHTHKPSNQSQQRPPHPPPKPPIRNHTADLKPTGANPFKKYHHRSYQWSTHRSTNLPFQTDPPIDQPNRSTHQTQLVDWRWEMNKPTSDHW